MRQLDSRTHALGVVHGDPTAGNVLDHERLWLVDWEYAQLADPLFDVAAVLVYYPAARAHRETLLQAAGLADPQRSAALSDACRVHAALGALWHHARGEPIAPNLGPEAGIFGREWAN
jgi:thiamine kinase-like enzyme